MGQAGLIRVTMMVYRAFFIMVANSLSCILLGFDPWLLITSLSSLSEWLSSCILRRASVLG